MTTLGDNIPQGDLGQLLLQAGILRAQILAGCPEALTLGSSCDMLCFFLGDEILP